jgi:uncharacterized protein YbbK (DUF523 family)
MKLVSACLLGIKCRYDGGDKSNKKIIELGKKEILIPVCPEQLGGLPTPRMPPREIQNGSGNDVLDGKCKVLNKNGEDFTEDLVRGAEEVLKIAKMFNIKEFISRKRSPSCGCGKIYDGTFSGKIIKGDGVTTALLKKNEIKVISEGDFE